GKALASAHNIHFYMSLVERARRAIVANRFPVFKREFYAEFFGDALGPEAPQGRKRNRRKRPGNPG
ncbi:MAG TPA: hypothetical protein VK997_04870, partial [Deferrisomatales bacterium]|nr:hypothetical protein [Deferrisomatales bacterium]